MTTQLQHMHDELVRRNYAATTIRTYCTRTCHREHPGRRLDQLGHDDLRRYQAYLFKERKLAIGTVGLHVAALRFFYVRVLKRRALKEELPTPKRHRRLPTILRVVRRWSTIRVAHRTYSVPAQLMGHAVEARVNPDVVEVRYRQEVVQTMPRLRKEDAHHIDYRHVIGWLVRKPGAFARYRYREDLYPSITFRRAYDALVRTHGEGADVEYLRILHLAATAGEARVTEVLAAVLDHVGPFDYVIVQAQVAPPVLMVPVIHIPAPDLTVYDALRAGVPA